MFNEPATSSAGPVEDTSIELFSASASKIINFGSRCDDPEGDDITVTIYYDKTSIAATGNDLKDILSFSAGILTIDNAIKTHKNVFTYQLWYSCSDSFNPSTSVDAPFRIVIFNSIYSPMATGPQGYLDMFY